jgi:hypothetical protein
MKDHRKGPTRDSCAATKASIRRRKVTARERNIVKCVTLFELITYFVTSPLGKLDLQNTIGLGLE